MILEKFKKQPAELKDYDVDYEPWLTPIADTLDDVAGSVTCLSDPDDTSLVLVDTVFTDNRAKFWLSGGTDGARYKLTILASTMGGRIDESELIFSVKDI